jgi:hydroxymethylpyrimidine pyrophosphatase-like HAD family hydrolase
MSADEQLTRWHALGASLPPGVVRVALTDVDGVITRGEGYPADLRILEALDRHNARARTDALVPAIALCTGRQAPYVELMAQMTGTFLPCIFEHGAGLYVPTRFRYEFEPRLGPDYFARLAHVRALLDGPLLRTGRAFVQPGKEATMSLYPLGSMSVGELAHAAAEVVPGDWTVAENVHGVEVRPRGIDKGVGAERLTASIGVGFEALAGIGDSDPDLSYLRRVAFSAAPRNATRGVQEDVNYVAAADFGDGLLEILELIEGRNTEVR